MYIYIYVYSLPVEQVARQLQHDGRLAHLLQRLPRRQARVVRRAAAHQQDAAAAADGRRKVDQPPELDPARPVGGGGQRRWRQARAQACTLLSTIRAAELSGAKGGFKHALARRNKHGVASLSHRSSAPPSTLAGYATDISIRCGVCTKWHQLVRIGTNFGTNWQQARAASQDSSRTAVGQRGAPLHSIRVLGVGAPRQHAAAHRRRQRLRLLVDLFLHEVVEAALHDLVHLHLGSLHLFGHGFGLVGAG